MPSTTARRLLAALTLSTALLATPGVAAAKQGPVIKSFPVAALWGAAQPNLDPAGANDWNCKPSAQHPRPVVLLHGTYANRFNSFSALSPAIKRQGYCVYALDYGRGAIKGVNGSASIRKSSKELAAFVDKVLAATGAPQVDLVGYSQGGLVARSYLLHDGGANPANPAANKVGSLVGLAVANHGTTLSGSVDQVKAYAQLVRVVAGDAAVDQFYNSRFLDELNVVPGSETVPGVKYTMIATRADEISQPMERAFLTAGPGATVTNIQLQTGCWQDGSDHFNITYSPRATSLTLKALDATYAGKTACTWQAPFL